MIEPQPAFIATRETPAEMLASIVLGRNPGHTERTLALRVLAARRPVPPELRIEYRDTYTIRHEAGCPDAEKFTDRGGCRVCGVEMAHGGTVERRWRDGVAMEGKTTGGTS